MVLDRNHVLQVYHTSNSFESMGVNGEALQLHAVHKKPYFNESCENPYQYYKSCDNPYQYYKLCENPYQYYKSCKDLNWVLQVTYAASELAMKSKGSMIK